MAISPAAVVLYSAVVLWLIITLVAQHTRFQELIGSQDGFYVVPRWTFFAPNPGIRDFHLVVRDRCRDGRTTGWRSVPVYSARPYFAYLWHPQKRALKIMIDAIQSIRFLLRRGKADAAALPFTMPYLLLLRCAAQFVPPAPDAVEFQFAIIESTGHRERKLECSFLSSFHAR